jgi:two-component system NtrC family sensor kinase
MLDRDQMTQVFLNLINNAGDAVDVGGTITLRTRHEDDAVHITVRDTGEGMTPEILRNVFQPFFTTKEVGKGTGLGLSISLSIVESMGGSIEIQSMPGSGSSVTVVLPLGNPEAGHTDAT